MAGPGFLRSATVWTHARGTLSYDIICGLILAFIFFVPKACFTGKKNVEPQARIQAGQKSPMESRDANTSKAIKPPDHSAK